MSIRTAILRALTDAEIVDGSATPDTVLLVDRIVAAIREDADRERQRIERLLRAAADPDRGTATVSRSASELLARLNSMGVVVADDPAERIR